MNEEEIKGKLLLPYLNVLGFDISEIELETSFSIRLGKNVRLIHGRSDILCKRNGQNLFIIELKKDSVSITQDDIDQGISYARLLKGNIAPFTIITNGKSTRIFDSISLQELTNSDISTQSSYWQSGYTISTDIDLRIRYEALKKFISFSPENLKRFCSDQVKERMGPIIGDPNERYAKFVEKLYVQRHDVQEAFKDFMESQAKVFAIVGSAGVGKTNSMCSLALQRLESEFVFFYNAAIINKSPLEHIVQDLNGVFSTKNDSDNVLKKLNELGEFLGKSVVIFIDAIDENIYSNLPFELSEIALSLRSLSRVKVCVSCKTNVWKGMLVKSDTPTHFYEELIKYHGVMPGLDNCPGFLLKDFGSEELDKILPIYIEAFGFKGKLSPTIIEALRNGFFLRIFSEVYSGKQVPNEINDKELIKTYLKQSLDRTTSGSELGLRVLSKIGRILIDHQYSPRARYSDEGVPIEKILENLNLSLNEIIPEDLFSRNILTKSSMEDSYTVSFYYSKIRDYIICFHSYRLDKLSDNEFYQVLEQFFESHIGESAFDFYMENASERHQSVFANFKRDKCLSYVSAYDSYLEKHFSVFKDKFDPLTFGPIGILLPNDMVQKDGYALFPLKSKAQSKVQFYDFGDFFSDYSRDLFFCKGVYKIHSSTRLLLKRNQQEILESDVFKQLDEIVKKGKISVYNSDILLFEQLSNILYFYWKRFGYSSELKDYNLPRFDAIYPIDLRVLKHKLYRFRVKEYYDRQNMDHKARLEKIEEAVQKNLDVPVLNIMGDFPPMEELFKIVDLLLSRGYEQIERHHLPTPDMPLTQAAQLYRQNHNIPQIRSMQFSEEQAKRYIEAFLKHFDICYRSFIEASFPTLKDRLPFYRACPHEYFVYDRGSGFRDWAHLGYRPASGSDAEVHFRHFTSAEEVFESGETNVLRGFSLDQIIHNDYMDIVKTIDRLNTAKVDEFCVIRCWVFKFIKEDFRLIFKEHRN